MRVVAHHYEVNTLYWITRREGKSLFYMQRIRLGSLLVGANILTLDVRVGVHKWRTCLRNSALTLCGSRSGQRGGKVVGIQQVLQGILVWLRVEVSSQDLLKKGRTNYIQAFEIYACASKTH